MVCHVKQNNILINVFGHGLATVAFPAERQTLVNSMCVVSLTLWHLPVLSFSVSATLEHPR